MKSHRLLIVVFAGFFNGLAFLAAGQTGRIAHFSHGGSAATLVAEVEAADEFGLFYTVRFKADTIIATSDTTAIVRGQLVRMLGGQEEGNEGPTSRFITYGRHQRILNKPLITTKKEVIQHLRQTYPTAKLLGFDTLANAAPTPVPELKKQKRKRKHAATAFTPTLPTPPHPGVWLAVATIVGLAIAGFAVGDKPRPTPLKAV